MSCQRKVGLCLILTVLALSPGVNELKLFFWEARGGCEES